MTNRSRFSYSIILLLLIGCVYGRVITYGFVSFDDPVYVLQNIHVQAGLTIEGIRWALTTFHGANWFPLTWLSHMTDAQLFGNWPGGHHLTSLLLHAANSLLLGALLMRLTSSFWKSSLVATLFALHPLHVESVAWISERKDVLSTFFFLTALFAYVRYAENRSFPRFLLVFILFALGLMSKPMLVSFPFVLLLLDWWPLCRFSRNGHLKLPEAPEKAATSNLSMLLLEKVPLFLLSLASAIVTILAQKQGEALISTEVLPLAARVGRLFVHYCWYAGKLVWPTGLAFYYPVTAPTFLIGLTATTCIVAISFLIWKRMHAEPYLLTGWLWFLVTLVPVIGLVAVGMQGTADRYAYIPSIGIFVAIVWLGEKISALLRAQQTTNAVIVSVVTVILAVLTWRQVGVWQSSYALSEHAVRVTPDNYVALTMFGDELDDQGRATDAINLYKQALQIRPDYEIALNSLGVAFCRQGQTNEALRAFTQAVRLRPSYADAYVNMGVCVAGKGMIEEAMGYFRAAQKIQPDHPAATHYLEQILRESGINQK